MKLIQKPAPVSEAESFILPTLALQERTSFLRIQFFRDLREDISGDLALLSESLFGLKSEFDSLLAPAENPCSE